MYFEREEDHRDDSFLIRPILKARPKIRPFAEAVLRIAAESGITGSEMRDAFGMLEDMAERRASQAKVAALEIRLPEDKK